MNTTTKGTCRIIALFGAIPIAIIITLGAWLILINVNNGAALSMSQALMAIFVGVVMGAAFFVGICFTQRNC